MTWRAERMCVTCGDVALDGHLTCGRVECDEAGARARRDYAHDDDDLPLTAEQLDNELNILDRILAREPPSKARDALLEVRARIQHERELADPRRPWRSKREQP